jgi:N-hydroxyarylamine O-acetyltransferase
MHIELRRIRQFAFARVDLAGYVRSMAFVPNLAAYFERIGYQGTPEPTLATLNAILRAHVEAIPFENLDVLLDRGISLDLAAIEAKLVHAKRGGYCFEQNSYLLNILTAVGFSAQAVSARVRIQRAREFTPARTHVFVLVRLDNATWLVDAGVGGLSLTSALRLELHVEQPTPHETRRLISAGDWSFESLSFPEAALRSPNAVLYHQAHLAGTWQDVCEFTLEPMPEIDREVSNWFTSSHPLSHFRERLMVARCFEGGRLSLLNRELTIRPLQGPSTTLRAETPDHLLVLLEQHFGLQFPAGTRFGCTGLVWDS